MAPGRVAFVLIDGLGDVSIPELGNRTPLEAAHTPHLDAIAAAGHNGLLDPVEPGLACGSDTAHLSILGYDPRQYYRGRGAFESMGAGLPMAPGDIAFKSNFATLDPATGIVISRRADRRFEDLGPRLCADLDGLALPSFPQHAVSVRYATEHRCGVVVRGPGLSDAISGTDPLKDNLPLQIVKPLDDSPEAAHTADVVNELSAQLQKALAGHLINEQRLAEGKNPANLVLLRGCGSRIAVQPFAERHGLRGAMVAPTKIIAGLGLSLGLELLPCPGATGDYRSDFGAKAATIAQALAEGRCDFGFLHVKAVDDTGHDRAAALKVKYLEVVDEMVGQLLRRLADAEADASAGGGVAASGHTAAHEAAGSGDGGNRDPSSSSGHEDGSGRDGGGAASGARFAVCVTGDHSTPVMFGDHSHEPVPFAIAHVADVVAAAGDDSLPQHPLPHIAHPAPELPPLPQLAAQADAAENKRQQQEEGSSREGRGDGVRRFGESAAAAGGLGRFPGCELMPLVQRFLRTAAAT